MPGNSVDLEDIYMNHQKEWPLEGLKPAQAMAPRIKSYHIGV